MDTATVVRPPGDFARIVHPPDRIRDLRPTQRRGGVC